MPPAVLLHRRRGLPRHVAGIAVASAILAATLAVVVAVPASAAPTACAIPTADLVLEVPGGGTSTVCSGSSSVTARVSRYNAGGAYQWTADAAGLGEVTTGVVDTTGRTWIGGDACCGQAYYSVVTGLSASGDPLVGLYSNQPDVVLTRDGDGALGTFTGPACDGCVDYTTLEHFPLGPDEPTVPAAPATPTVEPGEHQVSLHWTAPDDGDAPITGYRITPFRNGVAQTPIDIGAVTSKVITGLPAGETYSFTVAARNAEGLGGASPRSTDVVVLRTSAESFVSAAYQDFLDRAPTSTELSAGVTKVDAKGRRALLDDLVKSDAWLGAIVDRFYHDTLGRGPDAGGARFWTEALRSGRRTVAQAAAEFYASNEYFRKAGGTNDAWLFDVYDKVLGRGPDPSGLEYWVHKTEVRGRVSVAGQIYQSLESRRDRVSGLYHDLLGRAPDPSGLAHWSARVLTKGDLALAVELASSSEYLRRAAVRFP